MQTEDRNSDGSHPQGPGRGSDRDRETDTTLKTENRSLIKQRTTFCAGEQATQSYAEHVQAGNTLRQRRNEDEKTKWDREQQIGMKYSIL